MEVLIPVITGILILAGLAGTLLPFLPGAPLIFIAAFLYAWYTGFTTIAVGTLLLLLGLTVLSEILDRASSLIGAKKFGASRWGLYGAFLGGVLGLIFGGMVGVILGPFLGAFLLEVLHGRPPREAIRTGWGAFLGMLGGALGKLFIALLMVGIFLSRLGK